MALKLERAGVGAQAVARFIVGLAIVGPIGDLVAVDPHGNMRAVGHDRFVEPLLIVGHDEPRGDSTIDAASAKILRLPAIAVLNAVVDLALVAVGKFASNAANED